MKPGRKGSQLKARNPLKGSGVQLHTSIYLARGEDDHPDARLWVLLGDAVADVHGEGPIEKDGQQLEADDA